MTPDDAVAQPPEGLLEQAFDPARPRDFALRCYNFIV
jgi:hypothetical protein